MAGIGFTLQRILDRDNYTATLQTYSYAGIISSGPWVLSILSILVVGLISQDNPQLAGHLTYYLVTITYMMCASLIVTGGVQLMFTRFLADRLYEDKHSLVLSNLFGLLMLVTLVSGVLGLVLTPAIFYDKDWLFWALATACFVVLCNFWIVLVLLTALKSYNRIVLTMAASYVGIVVLSLLMNQHGGHGLLLAFLVGYCFLLFSFLLEIARHFASDRLQSFEFLNRKLIHPSLLLTGFIYALALWADKCIFWAIPSTSSAVAGVLRSSVIYDLPIFLAYLSMIPGMAVFFVRFETDFARSYHHYFDAILGHQPLDTLYRYKREMISAVARGLYAIVKVQGVTIIVLFLWTEEILGYLGISPHYQTLFEVDMISVGLQVVLMAIMSVFFYLDKRRDALILATVFLVTNVVGTLVTIQMNPSTYGYGLLFSTTVSTLIGLVRLNWILIHLQFETFMRR